MSYSFVVPAATSLQHNPDEPAHYAYIQHLSSGHLPVFKAMPGYYEGHQPPLYYLICVLPYILLHGLGDSFCEHAIRLVSMLIGLLTVVVSWLAVKNLFPEDLWLRLSVAAYIAVLPSFDNLSASVSNDTLTILLTTICLWQLPQLRNDRLAKLNLRAASPIIVLGLVIGAGILTKTSGVIVIPAVLFCTFLPTELPSYSIAQRLKVGAICCGTALAISLPWLIRNKMIYGSFLASSVIKSFEKTNVTAAAMVYWKFKTPLAYLIGVSHWAFASWWGVFDAEHLFWGNSYSQPQQDVLAPLPSVYSVIFVVAVASVIGLILADKKKVVQFTPAQTTIMRAMMITIAVNLISFIAFNLTFFQPQARYLYPSILPISILFLLGWRGWTTNKAALWSITTFIVCALVALNVYTIAFQMTPRFAGMSQ